MLNFECQRCGECCKRYYIVSLPEEVNRQAKFLGETKKEFIETHCQLFLHLFAREYSQDKIVVSSTLMPKHICDSIESVNGFLPNFFIAVPAIVFKRKEDGFCEFYNKELPGCGIYSERPLECRMFPFISDKAISDYANEYKFCEGLHFKDEKKSYVDASWMHFEQIKEYCDSLREKGFTSVWPAWPEKGVVLFENHLIGEINSHEFLDSIAGLK
ncbi:MAG TPA: YkgJ family cysteine cluster protein [archaeon]|nr:YkgJ family cysteine cluster protein [archaeon]